ncbi:STAS domain-containing protein [Pseudooceanicola sp. MF1-13]|uniref:STAS domain-containing protein n=1 Tax=Pseudooceanicola sp. MF1-13 TaxID=3379095 RepID=UPI003892C5E2
MDLTSETTGDVTIIHVPDSRIDAAAAIRFKDSMREHCTRAADRVILNLAQVDFIDSSGLGAIVASMKQLRDGQALELAALNPNVAKVFRLTRMDTVFTIHASADAPGQANVG